MKRKRKGFTLVELLVVIAILAVLATVSILGYSSFVKKASISNDQAIIQQMNLILFANESGENKARYPHEAVEQCIENGFIWENLTPSYAENHFAYDQDKNRFMLLDENYEFSYGEDDHSDIEANAGRIFIVVGNDKDISNAKTAGNKQFGLYLRNTFEYKDEIVVSVSIDTGIAENIEKVKYETDASQSVVIHTNSVSTTLTIAAPNSDVVHYGKAGAVVIESVKPASYEEKGQVSWLELTSGRVVLTSEADVTLLYIARTSATTFAQDVIIAIENEAKLPEFSRDAITIDQTVGTKVCTLETSEEKKNVYLFNNGIYEQIKVADINEDIVGTLNWIDESNASNKTITVAEDIANIFGGKKHNEYGGTSDAPKLNDDRTLQSGEESKVDTTTFVSTSEAKEKQKNKVVEQAKNAELGGVVVSSSEQLQNEINNILADLKANPEKCNEEVTIILKPSEDQYRTTITINQYPEWNGIYSIQEKSDSNLRSSYKTALKSKIVIRGTEGTIFGGTFIVNGFGYSRGGDPGFSTDVIYTKFEGITFDQSFWNEFKDGALSAKSTNSIWQPIKATGASSNVIVDNCTFIHTGRIQNGFSDAGGGYSFGFVCQNCTFTETDTVIQGYIHGQNTFMLDNITATNTESFLTVTNGTESPVKINNCSFTGIGHFIRMQGFANVVATNCTINTNGELSNKKSAIVLYRNDATDNWKGGNINLSNCNFLGNKQISLWNDKNKNQTFSTTITIDNCKDESGNKITSESSLNIYNPNSTLGTKTVTIK